MMRTLTGSLVLFLAAVAWASPIGVYIDDDFAGTSLDSGTWITGGGGTITVADSKVTLKGNNWGTNARMHSQDSLQFLPEAGQSVVLTSTGITTEDWGNGVYWGFVGAGGNGIQILMDSIDGYSWATTLDVKYNDTDQKFRLLGDNAMNGEFSIAWSTDNIKVWHDGTLLFDMQQDAPGMSIPTVVMRVYAESWNSQLQIGSAHLEIVPEPATMSLLGLGGLVAVIRKRR